MVATTIEVPEYDTKTDEYFGRSRAEILPFVPAQCRRLLDVGCGAGEFGSLVKRTRHIEVWGVEPVRSAAAKASDRLDKVINGMFETKLELPEANFDCVVFNDVLEHMVEPEQALRYAKGLLSEGGVVVASIPNIRYLGVVSRLVFDARWDYEGSGVLDKTHLRFFTKSSIWKLFRSEGYLVETILGINAYLCQPDVSRTSKVVYNALNVLFLGKFSDMKYSQFAVVAKVALPL